MYKKQYSILFLALLFLGCGNSFMYADHIVPSMIKKVLVGVGSVAKFCGSNVVQHRWKCLGALTTFYGYKLIQHRWKLYSIEKELHDVKVTNIRNCPCISWRHAEFNAPKEIKDKLADVSTFLKQDLNSESSVFYNNDGLLSKKITDASLKAELSREKELLKEWLSYIGDMCDAPRYIMNKHPDKEFDESFSTTFISDNEKLLQYIERNNFGSMDNKQLNSLQINLEKERAPHRGAWVIYQPYWTPWNWMIASCYKKARSVYVQVFREYIRLKAVENVVDSWKPALSSEESIVIKKKH